MVGVPVNFNIPMEGAVASYDALDAALGVGYKRYYGVVALSGAYILSPAAVDCYTTSTGATTSSSEADLIDLDFDLSFNFPQTIQGNMLIQDSIGFTAVNGSGSAGEPGLIKNNIFVYHVNNAGTETLLYTLSGSSYRQNTYGVWQRSFRDSLVLPIPKTNFSIGDKLRVNIRVNGYDGYTTGTASIALYHDATDRQSTPYGDGVLTNHDTNILVDVPYRVDL